MQHFASGKRYAAGFPACSRRKTSQASAAVPNESKNPVHVGMAAMFKRSIRIMKLTAVLLTLAFLQVQAHGLGQEVTLNVKEEKLEKVLSLIEKQTGYVFFTTADLIKKARPVTLQVRNEALGKVLDLCFRGQALDYVIDGKTISVVERKITNTPIQNIAVPTEEIKVDVTGRVVDEKGDPVQGATVMVKGSTHATATNEKGEFRLENVEDRAILVVSGINIETYEVKVRGREILAIKVQAKVAMSEAVTVTVNTGYQTFKPNEITGSVTTISKEQLDQRVAPDIISKLEGIANGLVFNKDPNTSGDKLRVRGESTIFANAEPLIIVDNFPYDGNINTINPNDVQSITILKDAAAASIWGVQAGNGVIVITTKRGKFNQAARIEFTSNLTMIDKPKLFYKPQIEPTDYIELETYLFNKGFYTSTLNDPNQKVVSPIIEILNKRRNGIISSQDSASLIGVLSKNDIRNDVLNYLYTSPILQQYQLNLSGGGAVNSYYLSVGYDKNLTTLIGNQTDRFTLTTQNTYKPIKSFELKAGITYIQNNETNNALSIIPNAYPYQTLFDLNGISNNIPQRRVTFEDTISKNNFLDWKYYPLQERALSNNKSKTNDIRINADAKYTILKGLAVELSYQFRKVNTKSESLESKESYALRDKFNTFAILSNGKYNGTNFPNGGIYNLSNSDLTGNYGRASLNYTTKINIHLISATAGFEFREVKLDRNSNRLYGYNPSTGSFVTPNLFVTYPTYPAGNNAIANLGAGVTNTGTINRFRTYYSSALYSLAGKYTFSGSIRFDGTNYFGVETNKKTVPLWSTGFKWDINKEKFFNSNLLQLLSFRSTFGYQGNIAQNVSAITTFQYLSSASYTGLPYARINNIPNPELRWEKTSQFNLGLDFIFKNNRISGSIDFFQKTGKDLIGDSPLDPTTGVTRLTGNFSAMRTKGIDVLLNTINLKGKFEWASNFNFNYAAEKVTKYDISFTGISYFGADKAVLPIIGQPLYALYSFRWAGLDPTTGDPRVILGDSVNKAYTNASLLNLSLADLKYSGRFNPPISGSIINQFSYKGVSIGVNIMYKLNYYFRRSSINYNLLVSNLLTSNGWQMGHRDYALRWKSPGDEKTTMVPSFTYPDNSSGVRDIFYNNSEILIEKGDHIRLQYINVGYQFNESILSKVHIKSLQLYTYINNIGILWRANKDGIDPDYPYSQYPQNRTYSIGLRATF